MTDDEGGGELTLSSDTILSPSRTTGEVVVPAEPRSHLLVFTKTYSWLYKLPSRGRVVIGRADTADLKIDDKSISRHHAELAIEDGTITIRDLDSQNGTFVNDTKIATAQVLRSNDVVTIHTATLILHSTATPASPSATVLEMPAFRQRLEDESDRAVRYERSFSLLCLMWRAPVREPEMIQRLLANQLRRIDAIAWDGSSTLYACIAEAASDEATMIAQRVRDRLDPAPARMGHAVCPSDGYDVDALLASARTAAIGAEPGVLGETPAAFQTLEIGDRRVIVADPAMTRLYALIERLAPVDIPVLIMGETGCGKELAATALHVLSRRRSRRLVSINCAAIQDTLVESELFGHERGAFTGAVSAKPGMLEAASGSTLFLDEVGELTLATQAKLLRVLETGRVTRVGDVREREIDVRIVAATNRNLAHEIANGRFRQDLFFRLTAATLTVPPLRERTRELPFLASTFLDDACRRASRNAMTLSEGAIAAMLEYPWPGNIRELKNLMQYVAAAHPDDMVEAEHVRERFSTKPPAAASSDPPSQFLPIADELREIEVRRMKEALAATGGNQARAAVLLSMPMRTFYVKAKQYGLTPKKKPEP